MTLKYNYQIQYEEMVKLGRIVLPFEASIDTANEYIESKARIFILSRKIEYLEDVLKKKHWLGIIGYLSDEDKNSCIYEALLSHIISQRQVIR